MALPKVGIQAVIEGMGQFNKNASSILKSYDQIDRAGSGLGRSSGGLGSSLSSLTGIVKNLGLAAGAAAVGGIAALGAGVAGFAVGGIKQAISLEQQMANIAAVMGRTTEEAKPLQDIILNLSMNPNLKVSATEAADAVELLARNGVAAGKSLEEGNAIIADMSEKTVALANATGAEFGPAADVMTDAMALFSAQGVTSEQVIDGITGVTVNSKFAFQDYADALANAGGAVAGIGLDYNDFNTILTGTASSFKSGGEAGTAFRNLFLRLSKPTAEMTAAMDKYGISLFDGEGNMRNAADVAQQLHDVFQGTATVTKTVGGVTNEMAAAAEQANAKLPKLNATISEQERELAKLQREHAEVIRIYGEESPAVEDHSNKIATLTDKLALNKAEQQKMTDALSAVANAREEVVTSSVNLTEAEKAELAATIGGTRGATAVIALSKLEADSFDKLSDSVNLQGQAMKSAAQRVDSVQGAWEVFKSIIQAVQIQVGEHFLPIIKELLGQFAEMASNAGPKVIDFFGRIANVVGAGINWIRAFIKQIKGLITTFQAGGLFGKRMGSFGSKGLLAALGIPPNIIDMVQGVLNGVNDVIAGFTKDGIMGALKGATTGGGASSILSALGFSDDTIKVVEDFLNKIKMAVFGIIATMTFGGTVTAGGAAGAFLTAFGLDENVVTTVQTIIDQIVGIIQNIPNTIANIASFVMENIDSIKGAFIGIGAVLASGAIIGILTGIAAAIFALLTPINLLVAAAALIGAAWAGNWFGIQQITTQVMTAITTLFTTNWPIIQAVALTALAVIQSVFAGIVAVVMGQVVPNIQAAFTNLTTALGTLGISWSDVWNAIVTAVGVVAATIGAILLALVATFTGFVAGVSAVILSFTESFMSIQEGISTVLTGVQQLIIGFVQFWSSVFSGDLTGAVEAWKLYMSGLGNFLAGVFQIALSLIMAPINAIGSFLSEFITSVIGFFTTLSDTLVGNSIIPDMVQMILDTFLGMISGITDIFGGITETISGLFSSIFGGGDGEGGGLASIFTFDPATIITGIQTITTSFNTLVAGFNLFFLTTLPTFLPLFVTFATTINTALMAIITSNTTWNTLLLTMTAETIPTFQSVTVTALMMVNQTLMMIIQTLTRVIATVIQLQQTFVKAMQEIEKAIKSVLKTVESLSKALDDMGDKAKEAADKSVDAIGEITHAVSGLADALRDAVHLFNLLRGAGSQAGIGGQSGMGARFLVGAGASFQGGTGLGGFVVPPNFTNDRFPINVSTGERVFVQPRAGRSVQAPPESLPFFRGQNGGTTKTINLNFGDVILSNQMDEDEFFTKVKEAVGNG